MFLITSRIDTKGWLKSEQLHQMNDLISYHCHTHELHNLKKIQNSNNFYKYNDLKKCLLILSKYNKQTIDYLFCFPFGFTGKYFSYKIKKELFVGCLRCDNKVYNNRLHDVFSIPRIIIT